MLNFKNNRNISVVVVDDDLAVLKTTCRILSRKGYNVVSFDRPLKALEYLHGNPVHLVITDLSMPEMDGVQLLLKIKAYNPKLPVILITGFATLDTAVSAMQMGAFDYIRKPFEIGKLYTLVEQALKSSDR